jgi:Ca-activated chloride channel family protein
VADEAIRSHRKFSRRRDCVNRSAAAAFLIAATAVPLLGQTFRTRVDLVHFPVVVTDKEGAPITGLTKDDFEIVEQGKAQSITYFAVGDPNDSSRLGEVLPLHIGLALDTSGSMDQDIHEVRTAVVKFLNANPAAVDVTLVNFDTEVRVSRYGANEYARLIERIRMRKPEGWTAFYDALGVYLNGAVSQDGQKILLVYTDGGDTRSSLTFSELLDLLKASDVTLYAIGYLERQSSSSRNEIRMQLQRMAATTGGQAYFPASVKELDRIYENIQKEIAARYSLGYVSSDARMDGSWRKVEVKLKRKDLKNVKLRTRPGYFAPYREGSDRLFPRIP